ncbi:MAG TPA: hypothetical protein VHA30_04335 [Patescibacteria group bacterium]|nr:hypothetical protein [Patescibacteria group bacterium]
MTAQTLPPFANKPQVSWAHFGVVLIAVALLGGVTLLQRPEFFLRPQASQSEAAADTPHYYAYVTPAEDQLPALVAGASTDQGPSLINEDGTVSPVDMGEVLGASTADVQLDPSSVKAAAVVPDSDAAVKKYLTDVQTVESGPIDSGEFEAALSSGDQAQINAQAQKLSAVRDNLEKMTVPQGLVKYYQLTVLQYEAAIGVLQNFTQADNNPQLVGDYLNQFLKSQQDLDDETLAIQDEYQIDLGYTASSSVESLLQPDAASSDYVNASDFNAAQ